MTSDELRAAAIELFGDAGFATKLAARLGVQRSSVHRYLTGKLPVPGPVAAAVECWCWLKKAEDGHRVADDGSKSLHSSYGRGRSRGRWSER